jgi:hypothetical protein
VTGFYEGTDGEQEPVPHDLDTHTDVTLTNPQEQDTLRYNYTTKLWYNAPPTSGVSLNLTDLDDVDTSGVVDGEVIVFSSGVWVNAPQSGGGGGAVKIDDLTDVDTSSIAPADNDVLVWDSLINGGSWVNSAYWPGDTFTVGSTNSAVLNLDYSPATNTGFINWRNGATKDINWQLVSSTPGFFYLLHIPTGNAWVFEGENGNLKIDGIYEDSNGPIATKQQILDVALALTNVPSQVTAVHTILGI